MNLKSVKIKIIIISIFINLWLIQQDYFILFAFANAIKLKYLIKLLEKSGAFVIKLY